MFLYISEINTEIKFGLHLSFSGFYLMCSHLSHPYAFLGWIKNETHHLCRDTIAATVVSPIPVNSNVLHIFDS